MLVGGFDRAKALLCTFKLTTKALRKEGALSSKGLALTAEHVYSIFAKGIRRKRRLRLKPRVKLLSLQLSGSH